MANGRDSFVNAIYNAVRAPKLSQMRELKAAFDAIPWGKFGARTPISKLAQSLLPVGNFDARLPPLGSEAFIALGDPGYEQMLMDIQGTAFQVGRGKLLTCWHVCETLAVREGRAYLQSTSERPEGGLLKIYRNISAKMNFIDPRLERGNPLVDVGMLICPATPTPEHPYEVPVVRWGDSTKVGVGKRVLIGGYPLGRDMFLLTATNRGIVQPTFYDGIISAVIPATSVGETRLLQISSVSLGGISGGVVCDADNGAVLGMVTSGLVDQGASLPITYAVPSEVLRPWADAISFDGSDGTRWR